MAVMVPDDDEPQLMFSRSPIGWGKIYDTTSDTVIYAGLVFHPLKFCPKGLGADQH